MSDVLVVAVIVAMVMLLVLTILGVLAPYFIYQLRREAKETNKKLARIIALLERERLPRPEVIK